MNEPEDKIPIDKIRNSAFSMSVGEARDGAIYKLISTDDALLIVLEHAIYAAQLADQIDPHRTNPAVPNTNTRLLGVGSKDAIVGRTLLTAHTFFKTTYLGSTFPEKRALSLALDLLTGISSLMQMHSELLDAVRIAHSNPKATGRDRSLQLPALGDAKSRCEAFAQKTGHVIKTMKAIALLFYPDKLSKKWFDSLIAHCAFMHGDDDPLTQFLRAERDPLNNLIEFRNKIEHPNENDRVNVHDFRLSPDLKLLEPFVEVVSSGVIGPSQPLATFMSDTVEYFVPLTESFIALLCGANVKPLKSFPIVVCELPESRRSKANTHQRLSYGIVIGGHLHPIG